MANQRQQLVSSNKPAQRSLLSRRNLIFVIIAGFIAIAALLLADPPEAKAGSLCSNLLGIR